MSPIQDYLRQIFPANKEYGKQHGKPVKKLPKLPKKKIKKVAGGETLAISERMSTREANQAIQLLDMQILTLEKKEKHPRRKGNRKVRDNPASTRSASQPRVNRVAAARRSKSETRDTRPRSASMFLLPPKTINFQPKGILRKATSSSGSDGENADVNQSRSVNNTLYDGLLLHSPTQSRHGVRNQQQDSRSIISATTNVPNTSIMGHRSAPHYHRSPQKVRFVVGEQQKRSSAAQGPTLSPQRQVVMDAKHFQNMKEFDTMLDRHSSRLENQLSSSRYLSNMHTFSSSMQARNGLTNYGGGQSSFSYHYTANDNVSSNKSPFADNTNVCVPKLLPRSGASSYEAKHNIGNTKTDLKQKFGCMPKFSSSGYGNGDFSDSYDTKTQQGRFEKLQQLIDRTRYSNMTPLDSIMSRYNNGRSAQSQSSKSTTHNSKSESAASYLESSDVYAASSVLLKEMQKASSVLGNNNCDPVSKTAEADYEANVTSSKNNSNSFRENESTGDSPPNTDHQSFAAGRLQQQKDIQTSSSSTEDAEKLDGDLQVCSQTAADNSRETPSSSSTSPAVASSEEQMLIFENQSPTTSFVPTTAATKDEHLSLDVPTEATTSSSVDADVISTALLIAAEESMRRIEEASALQRSLQGQGSLSNYRAGSSSDKEQESLSLDVYGSLAHQKVNYGGEVYCLPDVMAANCENRCRASGECRDRLSGMNVSESVAVESERLSRMNDFIDRLIKH